MCNSKMFDFLLKVKAKHSYSLYFSSPMLGVQPLNWMIKFIPSFPPLQGEANAVFVPSSQTFVLIGGWDMNLQSVTRPWRTQLPPAGVINDTLTPWLSDPYPAFPSFAKGTATMIGPATVMFGGLYLHMNGSFFFNPYLGFYFHGNNFTNSRVSVTTVNGPPLRAQHAAAVIQQNLCVMGPQRGGGGIERNSDMYDIGVISCEMETCKRKKRKISVMDFNRKTELFMP